jgi:threonine synthase
MVATPGAPAGDEHENPFLRFKGLLHAFHAAAAFGLDEGAYAAAVRSLDDAVARVDGRRFRVTPLRPAEPIAGALGVAGVWVKDETAGVAGSHKGRDLFGILLHLELARAAGLGPAIEPPLAIASCGNAALAAAVLARAAGRRLDAYVPEDLHPRIAARLSALGAVLHARPRAPGEQGDPEMRDFRAAVGAGAVPFACQGPENGLTLDGGRTLAFEIAAAGVAFDRVFVQVGGGALASSLSRGLAEAHALGALPAVPRIMAVQTERVAPLARAWDATLTAVRARLPAGSPWPDDPDARADYLRSPAARPAVDAVLAEAARHHARFFAPWPDPRPSAARGILDGETYDGLAVVRGMLATGGHPVTVDEATLAEARSLGERATGIAADETGTSGLAGMLAWRRGAAVVAGERVLLLFTGAQR